MSRTHSPTTRAPDRPPSGATLASSPLVAAMLLVSVAVPCCVALYVTAGSPVAVPAAVALVLAPCLWLPRVRRDPPLRAFDLYVSTVAVLVAESTEQWLAHQPAAVMRLFPRAYPPGVIYDDRTMIAAFPLAGSSLFLLGALALDRRHPAGGGAAWLLFVWALASAAAPFAYTLAAGAGVHYVGGMLVAPLVAACGVWGIRRLA